MFVYVTPPDATVVTLTTSWRQQ